MSDLFDETTSLLSAGVWCAERRHNIIAHNIANVDTPGFRAVDFKFENLLKDVMATYNGRVKQPSCPTLIRGERAVAAPSHVNYDRANALLVEDIGRQPRVDGNTVDIESQMTKLSSNAILHNSFIQLLNNKFQLLKIAINGKV